VREIITPEINKPVLFTLDWNSPLESPDKNGNPQWQYKVNGDAGIMWLPEAGKLAIEATGAKKGDTVSLSKSKNGNKNIWEAKLASSDRPAETKAQTTTQGKQASEVEQARAALKEAEERAAAAAEKATSETTPAQSWPLAEQLLPFLRGAIIACSKAEDEAKQNGLAVKFTSEDTRAFAITLYIEHQKGGR